MSTAPPATTTPAAATVRVLTLTAARPEDADNVRDLFAAVMAADPDYAPAVTCGDLSLGDWFARKRLDVALLAYDGDRLVGHVGLRHNHNLPGGERTPASRPIEMCRLAVHPDVQRHGVASVLVRTLHRRHGDTLWATCHTGYGSHRLLTGLGWIEHASVSWDDDPRSGSCLLAPAVLDFPAPARNGGPR